MASIAFLIQGILCLTPFANNPHKYGVILGQLLPEALASASAFAISSITSAWSLLLNSFDNSSTADICRLCSVSQSSSILSPGKKISKYLSRGTSISIPLFSAISLIFWSTAGCPCAKLMTSLIIWVTIVFTIL